MSKISVLQDFPSVLSLSGSAITTSYKSSSTVLPGQADVLGVWVYLTTADSGSTYTGANVKCQVSRDGSQWCDVQLMRTDNGITGNPGAIAAADIPAAGQTKAFLFQTSSNNPAPAGVRVQVEFTGAGGAAGTTTPDSVVVHVSTM